ncbi:hypothetical protein [Curtobacterium sp. RRHDQ10]|uniref:hypothetical protein n=1 Tax=Curtobacterium phyllosphaerae TaxID=3413379 RepID=UPI003BF08F14
MMRTARPLDLDSLRRSASEWRRRGLTPPDAIAAMVAERVGGMAHAPLTTGDPAYADFFTDQDACSEQEGVA